MWKILLVTAIITSISLTSSAQQPTVKKATSPILCMPMEELVKILKDAGETPVFVGEDDFVTSANKNLSLVITLNERKKEYTVFFLVKNLDAACILSTGTGNLIYSKTV